MTKIGERLGESMCTINGKPAKDTYDDLISAWNDVQQSRNPGQYDDAITKFVVSLHSLQETDCGGTKVFKEGGDQETVGKAMNEWTKFFEAPKTNPA
jgi:hypothetical protein